MARNKHPEETVQLILETAKRLFLEQGYEYTSIQNIIDNLGGLSKGAIYHHFRSKEEILVAILERQGKETESRMNRIRKNANLNGCEKIREMFSASLQNPNQKQMFQTAPSFRNNPQLLTLMLYDIIDTVVPNFVQPVIEEGVRDGSIKTEYPGELAELLMLTANLWLNPMVFEASEEQVIRRFMVYQSMLKGLGLDLLDDTLSKQLQELNEIYKQNK